MKTRRSQVPATHAAPNSPRVTITIGSRATFYLGCVVPRVVGVAGVTLKFEAVDAVTGVVVEGKVVDGERTPDGRAEVSFVVRTAAGTLLTLRRSWVVWCELAAEGDRA